MNLALFPITALLLLLSGVGAPAHTADGRPGATALFNAILGSRAERLLPRGSQASPFRAKGGPLAFAGHLSSPARGGGAVLPVQTAASPAGLRRGASRKPYRERFGFAEGALQPQGPPSTPARALFG